MARAVVTARAGGSKVCIGDIGGEYRSGTKGRSGTQWKEKKSVGKKKKKGKRRDQTVVNETQWNFVLEKDKKIGKTYRNVFKTSL